MASSLMSEEKALELLSHIFGLTHSSQLQLKPLPSYDDQNFHVKDTSNGQQYVFKIYSFRTTLDKVKMENESLRILQAHNIPVPHVMNTLSGEGAVVVDGTHLIRLLTFLPGTVFAHIGVPSTELLEDVGRTLGRMDAALLEYENVNACVDSNWNMKNALRSRKNLKYLATDEERQIASSYLDQFESCLPILLSVRQSVIHNDANEHNLIVDKNDSSKLAGIIDFGDMMKSYTVAELAIACAYCMLCSPLRPLECAADVVRGYHQALPLTLDEIRVLYSLICTRLVISVTTSAYALTLDPTNEYIPISQKPAWRILHYLHQNVTRTQAFQTFCQATGFHSVSSEAMTKEEIISLRQYHLGPSLSLSYRPNPLKIVRGKMQYLYDESGREYLDGVNNVCHVGHSHEEIVKAVEQQATILNTNTRYLGEELVRYIKALVATFPKPLSVCFLTCTGSEANDLALRLARTYTKRRDVVVVDGAYHGNLTSLVEISPYKFKGKGGFPCPSHVHVAQTPDCFRGPFKYDDPRAGEKYAESVLEKLSESKDGVAAFICESVLGCAGQIVLPPGYLKHAYAHARKSGAVCIADEVQVGFGRVGSHFWGFQTQDVIPDIVTMGKPIGNGHPIGAVVTTPEIAARFANGMEYFNTFGGTNLSCVVGLKVLEVIHKEDLQANSHRLGQLMHQELAKLKAKHPLIGDVRGLGLFFGIELVTNRDDLTPATSEASWIALNLREQGVLISTDGPHENVLKIKPPLCWTEENVHTFVRALDSALTELHKSKK